MTNSVLVQLLSIDEFQMALTNKKLNPEVETLFLTTSAQNMYLSSSMVKQIASMGGDISDFVPPVILGDILKKLSHKTTFKLKVMEDE